MLFLLNRYGTAKGILLSILAAYLLLPSGFDINFPGIPALNKHTLTSMVLLGYLVITRQSIGYKSLKGVHKLVFLLLMISPFLTSITNQERYMFIQGLRLYDGLSQAGIGFLHFLPFLLGLAYFKTYERQIVLLRLVGVAAVFYTLPVLWEIRMSPQLHTTIYGYFPHSFLQQYRDGGFRAVVFLGHGLLVAMFLAVGFTSLFALHKARIKAWRFDNRLLLFLLMATILLQKSLGAFIFTLIVIVMVTMFSYRKIHLFSVAIAAVFLTYPVTSSMGIFPHQQLVNAAAAVSPERAQSLGFRFEHENILLEHAMKKPLFGWGSWGRNRVYDPATGADLSVTDGKWVITLGSGGWLLFLGLFYFVVMAIYLAYRSQKHLRGTEDEKNKQFLMSMHSLIVALILIDQMPNSSLQSLYWLIIGGLFGRYAEIRKETQIKKTVPVNSA